LIISLKKRIGGSANNYAMTSMFSAHPRQKGRAYSIFNNSKLKNEFTCLANDATRNNCAWKLFMEMKWCGLIQLIYRTIFRSALNSIRVFPMTDCVSEFTWKSIVDVQVYLFVRIKHLLSFYVVAFNKISGEYKKRRIFTINVEFIFHQLLLFWPSFKFESRG
jgi:hypothetical protein